MGDADDEAPFALQQQRFGDRNLHAIISGARASNSDLVQRLPLEPKSRIIIVKQYDQMFQQVH